MRVTLAAMFDYVIVGAGSSGGVLAARLSEDPRVRVALIEAGPAESTREVDIPAAFSKLFNTERDWSYHTQPQPELNDRRLFWPRGKMLGGSSSINAMMWVRGVPPDYDAWAKRGNTGWSYDEILPYFKRAEDVDPERSAPDSLGTGGPLTISNQRDPHPTTAMFIESCRRVGIPRNLNANVGFNDGVDYTLVNQKRGMRWSVASGYLKPAMKRPNLTVISGALASRIVIEDGTARAIVYSVGDRIETVSARREIVLCGGAINSPQLLMLSGVGPRDHLEALGIDVVQDLSGVGSDLSDHLAMGLTVRSQRTDTLAAAESRRQLVKFLMSRKGLLTSNVGEAHAFLRSSDALEGPDIELIFAPVPYVDHGQADVTDHGMTVAAVLLQPESRGTIRLASTDPTQAPFIDPRYLSVGADLETLTWGVEQARSVLATSPLASEVAGPILPDPIPEDRDSVAASIRMYAETLYHPIGTCRMGVDERAVVDAELRVRGVSGLRVVDASVMPSLNRGHTHAPAVMIGERAADLIRRQH